MSHQNRGSAVSTSADDSALAQRAQAGELAAFEALVERHRDAVYRLALRLLGSQADAAEVAQETFLTAYRKLADFRGEASVATWLHRIAANFALMRLRQRKVANEVGDGDGDEPDGAPTFNSRGSLLDDVADWSRSALDLTLDRELRGAIDAAMAKLPKDLKEVFVLRDLEGLSYEDVALATGLSMPAMKSRLHRARLALRAAIDGFYAERDDGSGGPPR